MERPTVDLRTLPTPLLLMGLVLVGVALVWFDVLPETVALLDRTVRSYEALAIVFDLAVLAYIWQVIR